MTVADQDSLEQKRFSRRTVLKLLAVSLGTTSIGGLLSACGPDDAEAFNATKQAEAPAGGGGHGGGGGQAGGNVVEMNDQLKYVPDKLTISVGDTVVWRTVGFIPHTVTCDASKAKNPSSVKLPDGAEPFDSGNVAQNQEFRHTFDVAGEYSYFCIPHEAAGMVATVTVQ